MNLKTMCGDKKTGKLLFETGILIMIVNLLCVVGIWQSISNGWKVTGGGELFFQAFIQSDGKYAVTYLNQESIYISFLSVLFSFLGNKEELVSFINLILQLTGIGFFYFGAKKLFNFVFPLAAAIISGILSGCFYPVTTDNSMHIIWFLSGFAFWLSVRIFHDFNGLYGKHILSGILLGIFCYVDLAGFFFLSLWLLFILTAKETGSKERSRQLLLFIVCSLGSFLGMFGLWNSKLSDSTGYQYWLKDKFKYFSPNFGLQQYISLVIILAVLIIFYVLKRFQNTEMISKPASAFGQTASTEEQKADDINESENSADPTSIDAGTEQMWEDNSAQENKKPVKFLENPLPVPKKHVRKKMDYAFEPSAEQMHYDLNNYRLDDDYDLKD